VNRNYPLFCVCAGDSVLFTVQCRPVFLNLSHPPSAHFSSFPVQFFSHYYFLFFLPGHHVERIKKIKVGGATRQEGVGGG
jgi:hypothetical protein